MSVRPGDDEPTSTSPSDRPGNASGQFDVSIADSAPILTDSDDGRSSLVPASTEDGLVLVDGITRIRHRVGSSRQARVAIDDRIKLETELSTLHPSADWFPPAMIVRRLRHPYVVAQWGVNPTTGSSIYLGLFSWHQVECSMNKCLLQLVECINGRTM